MNMDKDEPRYEFISYPYRCNLNSSPNIKAVHTVYDRDISLTDLLDSFKAFIQAAGYHVPEDTYLALCKDGEEHTNTLV